jgi:hypothetical protein
VKGFQARLIGAAAWFVAATGAAHPAHAGSLLISGGTPVASIPQGDSGNIVLDQAGISVADGQVWVDATLLNEGDVTLTAYDVGSESEWKDQIRLYDTTTETNVTDKDDHKAGTTGVFVNGSAPFQPVGSLTQKSGVTGLRFHRTDLQPTTKLVVNGQSPATVAGFGIASIAFAYLDDDYRIVSGPTNRILVLLEDGNGADRDYDDYVGMLVGPTIDPPPPPPTPPVLSISGGASVGEIPQGSSGNSVLGPAGVGFDGGALWVDGTLDILGSGATVTLYDVGSESHWLNEIRVGSPFGDQLRDWDDHFRGDSGTFTNGTPPFQQAGSVALASGVAEFEFWRLDPTPEYQTVVNGQSPMMMVPGYGYASIALAYLNGSNQIVSGPTDRVLVLLEDGGSDRDYDDYVGILTVHATVPPPYPVSPNALAFGNVLRHTSSAPLTVTITNSAATELPITSVSVTGSNAGQFSQTNYCPAELPAGASCTVDVVFAPVWRDSKTSNLTIKAGGATYVVGLFGNGV